MCIHNSAVTKNDTYYESVKFLYRDNFTLPNSPPPPPIPKGNMGYAQYAIPHTVAVEPTFVAFL